MIRKAIPFLVLSLLASLALVFTLTSESHASARVQATHTVPTMQASKAVREPLMARMVNCEDYDIQPCYTYDDGAWRMVLSYMPYKSVTLAKCKHEDASGKQQLPCIWKDNNRVGKGQPKTRNVFTKNG